MCVLHTSLLLSITSDVAVNVGVDAYDPRVVAMDTTDASIERTHELVCVSLSTVHSRYALWKTHFVDEIGFTVSMLSFVWRLWTSCDISTSQFTL